jgi:streptomycin 6-kinase
MHADLGSPGQTARDVAANWGLRIGRVFARSANAFVAEAGPGAVIKVTSPADDEADQEGDALGFWGGDGAARLLRRDPSRRALLIERARPGDDLSALPDALATAIAVGVATRLWRAAAEPFRWIGDWVPRWLDEAERKATADLGLLALAREIYPSLEVSRSTLVHGDLHHHNILDAGGRHFAIDPKAMLGEPEFDVPPFLWNPIDSDMRLEETERRLAAFGAAGLDQRRMRAWAIVRGSYLGVDGADAEVLRALI